MGSRRIAASQKVSSLEERSRLADEWAAVETVAASVAVYTRDLECALERMYAAYGNAALDDETLAIVDGALHALWERRRLNACNGNAEQAAAVERMLESSGAR